MSLPEPRRLSRHVAPDLPPARLTRQWATVQARLGVSPERRWLRGVALASAVALVAVLGASWLRGRDGVTMAGVVVESGETDVLTLPDGTRIKLAAKSRIELVSVRSDAIEIALDRGELDLDVVHRSGHSVVVRAGRFDVIDQGTRFHVERDAQDRCAVAVVEGHVEIRTHDGSGEPRSLGAGETWSSAPLADVATAPELEPPATAPLTSATPGPVSSAEGTWDAQSKSQTIGVPPYVAPTEPNAPSPSALLDTAKKARLAGRPKDAATALDTLRRRYRNDPRAPLAAFELGRLRLDSLGDAAGAVEALNDAIALAPSGSFREDAEARRVDALDAEGAAGCAEARDAYLTRYPKGIHATMVAARCNGK